MSDVMEEQGIRKLIAAFFPIDGILSHFVFHFYKFF
jgi:phosphoketolase